MPPRRPGAAKKALNTPDEIAQAKAYFKNKDILLAPPIMRAAYSDRMAWILASMSHLAYDRFEEDPKTWELFVAKLEGGGFKLIQTFNSKATDTQAFLATSGDYAVLAFRGTEPTKKLDVLTDIKATQISAIEGGVHRGFREAYASVSDSIVRRLSQMDEIPLYITGHSLGAALATVATQELENHPQFKYRIAACYTFGSPRVGNNQYDKRFKAPIYRIVNTTDIVTVLPLLAMGYVHIGDIRFLGRKDGDFSRGIPIVHRVFLFVVALFRLFRLLIGDHAILEYRKKLEAIADKRNIIIRGR